MSEELRYEDIEEGLEELLGEPTVATLDLPEGAEVVYVHPFEIGMEFIRNLVPGIVVTDRSLELPEDATMDDVQNVAEFFESAHASIPLLWGDLINEAEKRFRTNATQILSDRIGKAEGTIRNWRYVCSSIPKEIRPDPRIVRISKLYHIAGLMTIDAKRFSIELAESEGLETSQVGELCDLFKTYPDDVQESREDFWVDYASGAGLDFQELLFAIRGDLIDRGYLDDPDAGEDYGDGAVEQNNRTGAQTAEDLVDKLLELAAEAEENTPQNVLALFASTIRLAKGIAFSSSADVAEASYTTLGTIAGHLLDLRLAQIEAGATDVGCNCTISDIGELTQLSDCPVHGEHKAEGEEPID